MRGELHLGYEEHSEIIGKSGQPARCAVVTVSDTRDELSDGSGELIKSSLAESGHLLVDYRVVKDEARLIQSTLEELSRRPDCQVILLNGGTGISRRDVTSEVVNKLIDKRLDGFGELFRYLSYEEIGCAAMLSRAVAGLYLDCLIFAMPGSTAGCRLAMEKLILPELAHLVWEAGK